ncbi:twin-arginine translocase TatA/TatE family subunit [Tepidamorphus sp. 3E244]|uniref:twin-arginine translocase TatA/TatE family subunit n=1 Tax=Tepidamorphus sp. 3E244 TaxID=3385498 RepID=UPI0038FC830E
MGMKVCCDNALRPISSPTTIFPVSREYPVMMPSWFQILLVVVLLVLLFGRGKISELMGDVAKGIKSFKQGMSDDDDATADVPAESKTIDHQPTETVKPAKAKTKVS